MRTLKVANVQKCLQVLRDFHGAVPDDNKDKEFIHKKNQASHALDHLASLFHGEPGESEVVGECGPGVLKVHPHLVSSGSTCS